MQPQVYDQLTIDQLQSIPIWVGWVLDPEKGKVPKNSHSKSNGTHNAMTSEPKTWSTFAVTKADTEQRQYNGNGLCLHPDMNLGAIDIDGHTNGHPSKVGFKVLDLFKGKTYIETSPSGTGYRILFFYDKNQLQFLDDPKIASRFYINNRSEVDGESVEIEMYLAGHTKKFVSFTGDQVFECSTVNTCTTEVLETLQRYMRKSVDTTSQLQSSPDIIEKARNGANGYKFSLLYDKGDISLYDGDQSRADLGLCEILAYWFNNDFNAIDQAFRGSALYDLKWETRADYRQSTIERAIAYNQQHTPVLNYPLPGQQNTQPQSNGNSAAPDQAPAATSDKKPKNPKLKISTLETYLQNKGWEIRLNDFTHKWEIGNYPEQYNKINATVDLPVIISDDLKTKFSDGGNVKMVASYLGVIAGKHTFNPLRELLDQSADWDKIDRVQQIYDILDIDPSDTLSQTLIYKALLQAVALALYNTWDAPFGADGVLTLNGEQGIGKTTFCRKLAITPALFKEGKALVFRDKDTLIRATSGFITELGEVSRTMIENIDQLKAFLTNATDEIRPPYAHADVPAVRRTSFIATCNDEKFLLDTSGNRRWWTVQVGNIKLDQLKSFDALQLWKQIDFDVCANIEAKKADPENDLLPGVHCFRLTPDERAQLNERNSEYTKPVKAEDEIADILNDAKNNPSLYEWNTITISEFKLAFAEYLNRYTVQQVGVALTQLGYGSIRSKVDGKVNRVRYLPTRKKSIYAVDQAY